ncbi:MAG TPA: mercuric transporter MerT family protein [Usitatibacter sp.]|nr:mercuric transporter MerT family protein [Usitatibacter sp.]
MNDAIAATTLRTSASLLGGLLAAFGATACCFGPLLLVAMGVGGAWAGRLQLLEPYQPYFYGLTLLFVGLAFHRLYVRPRRCAEGEPCESPIVLRRQRIVFWLVVGLIALMSASPYLAPLFY